MPNQQEKEKDFSKKPRVKNIMQSIQKNISGIYKSTYMTNTTNNKDLNDIKTSIDGSIDDISFNVSSNVGTVSMSKVYNRLMTSGETESKKEIKELEEVFNDKSITDGFMMDLERNKSIREYDEDIDILCRYMPMLEDTIDAKKDNVLSADHFNKDFLNITNKSNMNDLTIFNERIDFLKEKYELLELTENMYYKTDKYGETYTYNVPYNRAFEQLLAKRNAGKMNIVKESFDFVEIAESSNIQLPEFDSDSTPELNVEFNTSGILESAVMEYKCIEKVITENSKSAFDEKIVPDDLKFKGLNKGAEGLIQAKSNPKDKINVPGTIIKDLRRDKVIPIYIENICLGYYYLESDFDEAEDFDSIEKPFLQMKNGKLYNSKSQTKNMFLQKLSKQMSDKIDATFINSNQDISKELYMILSQSDILNGEPHHIRITFLPVDDVIHTYLKKDPITHRGISGLHNSITMAKLYTSIYLTDVTGILTRSQDKRVYYVKQNVDTNISKVLLNTLNQIKKSNMGARELVSAKNMLNIVGKYNDYVIPVGPSGAPIEFEIMQGQDIQIKTDLLDILEQGAINATGVPYEYMQSRKTVDYAVRLTMSNGKFLRKCFKDQSIFEKYYSELITKIYNNEYGTTDELEVKLPPPTFLSIVNTNQIMESNKQFAQSIIEMECGDIEDQALIAAINRKVQRHILGTYVDGKIYDIINQAKIEYNANRAKQDSE